MFKKRRSRDDSISRGEDPVRKSPGTFHVFVTPDGTATLDGERLRSNGNRAETAVLDELHRHAKNRDSSVEATVLDQRHGWLLRVRVTPDGASELAGEPRELQLVADDPGSLPIGSETTVFLRTPASEEPVTSAIPVQAPPRSGGFVGPLRTDDR